MSSNMRNNIFLSSSLMFLLVIGSSYAISSAEIKAICDKALNHSFCFKFLNSKSSAPNIQALGKSVLESAQARTQQNLNRIQSIIKGDVDPRTKLGYRSCLDNFESAKGNLEEAMEHLEGGDGFSMNMKVSAAMDEAVTCLDDTKRLKIDASVLNNTKELKNICGTALVIANMLPKRG